MRPLLCFVAVCWLLSSCGKKTVDTAAKPVPCRITSWAVGYTQGLVWTFDYDEDGDPLSITPSEEGSFGSKITFTYDTRKRLTRMDFYFGAHWDYSYEGNAMLPATL